MVNFLNLPTVQAPRNALVDLSPIGNAIDGNRRNALMVQENARQQEELGMRKSQFEYQQTRDKKQDARQDEKFFAERAQAVMNLPATDPRRAAVWQKTLEGHPGRASLTPDYLDPVKGPEMVLAEYGALKDPREDKLADLKIRREEAEIGKLNRAAADEGSQFGKNGTVVQGPDGRYYSVRYSADGTERINPISLGGQNMTPAKGVDVVGDTMFDKATGQPVRNVGSSIAAGETAKVVGRETGEGQMALPKTQRSLQQYEIKSANVDKFIDEAIVQAQGTGAAGFVGGMTRQIPGSPGYNLVKKIDPIIANLGFDELQTMRDNSPTGGALGAVAVQEMTALQSTLASLDTAQSPEQLVQHLGRLKEIKAQYRELKRQAYQQDVARFGAAAVQNPQGQPPQQGGMAPRGAPSAQPPTARPRAVNPQTGQTVEFDGQQWIEVR